MVKSEVAVCAQRVCVTWRRNSEAQSRHAVYLPETGFTRILSSLHDNGRCLSQLHRQPGGEFHLDEASPYVCHKVETGRRVAA